jgi:Flp pilus assembly protein TadD
MRQDLKAAGIGDGAHGIRLQLNGVQIALMADAAREVVLQAIDRSGNLVSLDRRQIFFDRAAPALEGRIDGFKGGRCFGWVWDGQRPEERLTIKLIWNGTVVAQELASKIRGDLLLAGIGDGGHGFEFDVPHAVWRSAKADDVLRLETADGYLVGTIKVPSHNLVQSLVDQGRQAERQSDLSEAIRYLDEALQLSPDHVDALWVRARIAANQSDVELARRLANRVLELHPAHPRAAVILGRIAYSSGDYADAVRLWQMVKPGDTAYREALIKGGRSLQRLGRLVDILKLGHTALRLNAADLDAHRLLVDAYLSLGAAVMAERHLRTLAAAQPEDRKIANQLLGMGRPIAVLKEATKPLEIFVSPTLRECRGPAKGSVVTAVELATGIVLKPTGKNGVVDYRLAEPQEFCASNLPHYGLHLEARRGGAELACRLLPDAADLLRNGIRYYFEARSLKDGSCQLAFSLAFADGRRILRRDLKSCLVGSRARLLPLDLTLSDNEALFVSRGGAWIVMSLPVRAAAALRLPRPLGMLPVALDAAVGPEGPQLTKWSALLAPMDRISAKRGLAL